MTMRMLSRKFSLGIHMCLKLLGWVALQIGRWFVLSFYIFGEYFPTKYLQNISEQGWYFLHPLPFYNRLLYTTQVQLAIKFHNLALWRPGSDENSLFMLRVIFLDVDCQLQHYHAHELQGASTDEQGGVPSERTFWKRFLHQICLQYSDVVSKSGMSSSSRVQLRAKMLEEKVRCKKKRKSATNCFHKSEGSF